MNFSRKDVTEKDKILYTIWKNNRDFCDRLNRYQLCNDDIISKTPEPPQEEDVVFVSEVDHMKRPTAGAALVPELLRKPRKSSKITLKPIIRPRAKKTDEGGGVSDDNSTRFFMEADAVIAQKQIEPLVARSTEADCAAKKMAAVGRPSLPLLGGCSSHQRLYFPVPPPPLPSSLSLATAGVTSWRTMALSNSPSTQPKLPEPVNRSPVGLPGTSSACDPTTNAQVKTKMIVPNKVRPTAATGPPPARLSSAVEPSNCLADAPGGSTKAAVAITPAHSSKKSSKKPVKFSADRKPTLEVKAKKKKLKKVLRPDLSLARPTGEMTLTADESTVNGFTTGDSSENMQWAAVDVSPPPSVMQYAVPAATISFSIGKPSASGLGVATKREIVSPTPNSNGTAKAVDSPVHKPSKAPAGAAVLTPKVEARKSATAVTPPKSTSSIATARTTTVADIVVPLRNPKKEPTPYLATASVAIKSSVSALSLSSNASASAGLAAGQLSASPSSKLLTPKTAMKREAFSQRQQPELPSSSSSSSEDDINLAAAAKTSSTESTVAGVVKRELLSRHDDEDDSSSSSCASSPRPATASASIREMNNLLRSAGSLLDVRPTNLSPSVSAHLDETINSVFRSVTAGARQSTPSETPTTEETVPPVAVAPSQPFAATIASDQLSTIDEAIRSVLEHNTTTSDARPTVPPSAPATQDQEWIFDEPSGRSSSSPVDTAPKEAAAAETSDISLLRPVKLELSASQEADGIDSPLTADDHDLIRRYEREHRSATSATGDIPVVATSPRVRSFENAVVGSASTSTAAVVEASTPVNNHSGEEPPLRKRVKVETRYLSDSEEAQTEINPTFPNIVELGNGVGVYDRKTENSLKRCWQWSRDELMFEVELKMITSQIAATQETLADLINRQREVLSKRDGMRERIQREYAKIKHKAS